MWVGRQPTGPNVTQAAWWTPSGEAAAECKGFGEGLGSSSTHPQGLTVLPSIYLRVSLGLFFAAWGNHGSIFSGLLASTFVPSRLLPTQHLEGTSVLLLSYS